MKVLVVGQGAREHAIAKKLAEADVELHAAMSRRNPGIASISKRVEIMDITDTSLYDRFKDMDVAFIGPEAPLAAGATDRLNGLGVPVVGPTLEAARLEWSKAFARQFLEDHGIDGNPEFSICRSLGEVRAFLRDHPEVAVKPDVLTGGKGVKITGEHLHSSSEVEEYAAGAHQVRRPCGSRREARGEGVHPPGLHRRWQPGGHAARPGLQEGL